MQHCTPSRTYINQIKKLFFFNSTLKGSQHFWVSHTAQTSARIWCDLEASKWLPLLMQHKVMLKLKSMTENKENDNFMMFLCKRPEVWPRWEFMDEKLGPNGDLKTHLSSQMRIYLIAMHFLLSVGTYTIFEVVGPFMS